MEYLFAKWERLRKVLAGKYLMLFLDYDGTLTPIASTPEKAAISRKMRKTLEDLAKSPQCKVAIVSGRELEDIKKRVGAKDIIYVGNHGFEIKGPRIKFESPLPSRYRKTVKLIKDLLQKRLSSVKGAYIEDKGFSLSLHYRLADKKDVPLIKAVFYETVILHEVRDNVRTRRGKMVLELMPPIDWDKGKVALWLLSRQRFILKEKKRRVFPIYIGDDISDEDAFSALMDRGMTIFIGRTRKSKARYYLKNTKEVGKLLKQILGLQKGDRYDGIDKGRRAV